MKYKVLGVIFEITKKRYYFQILDEDKNDYKKGDKVIVDTIRGQELGTAYSGVLELEEEVLVLPLKPVIKKASEEEMKNYENLKKLAEEAYEICKKKILENELPMKLITSEYTFDKTKLIFYFTAEGRIDFRKLVKDLAAIFKLRIELRQIGVRDEARILGSLGICGQGLCCRTFINKFDSVSIKMARDQGLVINPSKISGACGRLLCCINYENKQYEEALHLYPALGQRVSTDHGNGRVNSICPLSGYMYIDVDTKGLMKIDLKDVGFDKSEAQKIKEKNSEVDLEHKKLEED